MGENEKLYLTHSLFPNSADFPFEITSPETTQYNCVAWALGDSLNKKSVKYGNCKTVKLRRSKP